MGHFSKFLHRGSERLHSELLVSGRPVPAPQLTTWLRRARRGGQQEVVVVLMNDGDSEQLLAIKAGDLYANITAAPHSMHSLMFPASLLTAAAPDTKRPSMNMS